MDITLDRMDDLNAILEVKIVADDYSEKVEKSLKEQQKKINLPGFRPGKIPASVIKKMVGKSVMVDEINKIVVDSMFNYLDQNKIEILGNPLPNYEKTVNMDWDTQTEFSFFYDLGLSPDFEFELSDKFKVDYYNIAASDEEIGKYLTDIRKRYGKYSSPEISEDDDLLYGEFLELDDNGEPKEKGVKHTSSILISSIEDKKNQKKFIGLKKDDVVDFELLKVFTNKHELSHLINVPENKIDGLSKNFRFKVQNISRNELAEINEELFEKVYKDDKITSEAELKERIRKDAENTYRVEADKKFMSEAVEMLINNVQINLPDEFLKRWLVEANKEKFTREQVESEYKSYQDSLKWQLIENRIIRSANISVTEADVKNFIKEYFRKAYPVDPTDPEAETRLDEIADSYLKKKENAKNIYDKLYDEKLTEVLKSAVTLNMIEISYEDFIKKMYIQNVEPEHDHEHCDDPTHNH
jgi:trigger factor